MPTKKLKKIKPRLTSVIAEREFRLVVKGRKPKRVLLRFGKPRPFPEGGNYYCVLAIDGLDEPVRTNYAGGVDGFQALYLAMHLASTLLMVTRAYQEGRLTFAGSSDLGLPFFASQRDLVRTDRKPRRRTPAGGPSARRRS